MPNPPTLQQFVEEELGRSRDLIARVRVGVPHFIKQSEDYLTAAPAARQAMFEVIEALQRQKAAYDDAFVESLTQSIQEDMQEQPTKRPPAGDFGNKLTLLDEGRVASDIEISRVARLISEVATWEIKELQAFTSTLCGQINVISDTNPLRPTFFARALWDAACAITSVSWQLKALLQASGQGLATELKMAWAAAATRLEDQGVKPGIYRTAVITPGTAIERNASRRGVEQYVLGDTVDPVAPSPPVGNHYFEIPTPTTSGGQWPSLSPQPTPSHRAESAIWAAPPTSPAPDKGRNSPPDFQESLLQFEDSLQEIEVPSAHAKRNSSTASPRLRDHQVNLSAGAPSTVDREVIDLLSRLFDNILSDIHLHPGFRALIARLQASVLRLALREPRLMEERQHPVWALMDLFGTASAPYTGAGDPRLASLLQFCEELVSGILKSPKQDANTYQSALDQLRSWLDDLVRQQLMEAQAQVGQLARLERRNALKQHLSIRLRDQIGQAPVSNTFRHFLTDSWAQVLAESIQNFGEQSEITCGYVKAVDDLLWSINPRHHTKSRARLLEMLPWLLQQLKAGMASISLPAAEQDAVMAELVAMHTAGLRAAPPQANEESADEAAARIVRQIQEDEEDDPEVARPFADSLIDLGSMETVPAELMDAAPSELIKDTPHKTPNHQDIKVGKRLRIFVRGQWVRAQLLWRSPLGELMLFAGEAPGRTHSITEAALKRLQSEGLVLPLEDQTLFERATAAVVRELT